MMPLLNGRPAVNAEYMKWPGMIRLRLSAFVVCPVAGACATAALRSSCPKRKRIDGRTVRRRAADLVVMFDPPGEIIVPSPRWRFLRKGVLAMSRLLVFLLLA